jgi:hypothetical protein
MKKAILLMMILALTTQAFSQNPFKNDTLLTKSLRTDFSIPDMPAFKAIGIEPSNILRPADPKEFAIMVSDFATNIGTLPQAFAAEFAPFRLFNPKLTIQDYQKNHVLYNTRVSLASKKRTNSGTYDVGIGLRFTLYNGGDLKLDTEYLNRFFEIQGQQVDWSAEGATLFRTTNNLTPIQVAMDSVLQKKQAKLVDSLVNARTKIKKEMPTLVALRKQYRDKNWNKTNFDIAYSFLGVSPDSLVKDVSVSKHLFWATLALPVKSWGQWLIGINYEGAKVKNDFFSKYVASTRLYGGNNAIKGFIESQYKYSEEVKSGFFLFNLGTEYLFRQGMWLVFQAGLEKNTSTSIPAQFVSNINLKFTLPENSAN